jgi:regulator of RNase E activity RraB
MKSVRLLTCATLVIAWFTVFPVAAQTSIAEQQDAQVIESLRHNGADVSKVHDIDFFLVFDREADATAIAEKVRVLGYEIVGVNKTSTAKQWELHAKRKMVPELGAMQAATRVLQALASARGGYYDGWGTVGIK